ncbi:hypothetical protein SAMN05216214_102170 [Atopomonas hussainii]|uniref:Chromosome partitioning protein n=1 Tax=Atopomonas hussainii TaxID=1429083 RepID=A0A1H7GS66_9GAMM|nr:chromosome partitioning protein [Atopomonas hussainii]SEK40931.1 hypothetical protein SAMN05216214_102170 [Atopomonas hussainii]
MSVDIAELSLLAPIFRELFKGYHISPRDHELYAQLNNLQDSYRSLFKTLGFELVCDHRGFYYFVPEQTGAQVNKTAQRLALFTFIVVEHLADQNRDPLAVLDGGSLGRDELPPLFDKYRELFVQAEVLSLEDLDDKILRRLVQLGFAREDNGVYQFLPPMHRFLDVCLSVQQDRDLAASLASDLPLPAPVLPVEADEADEVDAVDEASEAAVPERIAPAVATAPAADNEDDELARAIAEERAEAALRISEEEHNA